MAILRFRHTPISLATTFGIIGYSLFLNLLRWFSSVGTRFLPYVFRQAQHDMTHVRFPHSAIPGSFLAVRSPRLIADFYGLHRYWLSRHPLSVPLITFLCIDLTSNRCLKTRKSGVSSEIKKRFLFRSLPTIFDIRLLVPSLKSLSFPNC